jgi:hypothetical protein
MPDLFFYRDPEEADKEERERQEAAEAARYQMHTFRLKASEKDELKNLRFW